jgi:hypothetical protein
MDHHPVVDGRVGGHHDHLARDLASGRRLHVALAAALELLHVHVRVDLSARSEHGLGQAGEVAQRMELALPREAQGGAGVEGAQRSACDLLDFEAGAAGRLGFAVELVRRLAGRDEQVAVHPREVAGDAALGTIASMRSMAAAWLCAASRDPPSP